MKKIVAVILSVAMAVGLTACGNSAVENTSEAIDPEGVVEDLVMSDSEFSLAMLTDNGDITDQSFNQTTYEACKEVAEENHLDFEYYKPEEDSDTARIAAYYEAVADGYNVIVVAGNAFSEMIQEVAGENEDIKIIALDVSRDDFSKDYQLPKNVSTFAYQEELAGYMAGVAAVKEGYRKLGFLGGKKLPAVVRYGYGFIQGVNDAAEELGITDKVQVNYVYGGQFYGDEEITDVMDSWYKKGTEVVFACGGGIFSSACEAAVKEGGKVIGVDVDQRAIINNTYGEGLCLTSAMKGLEATIKTVLNDLFAGDWENSYAGRSSNLGIYSDHPEDNFVQLPMDSWSMKEYTIEDYKELVKALNKGDIRVKDSIKEVPTTKIKVDMQKDIH